VLSEMEGEVVKLYKTRWQFLCAKGFPSRRLWSVVGTTNSTYNGRMNITHRPSADGTRRGYWL
jgi:hypothetical protein